MKFLVAFVLVIISMVAAEGPRPRPVLARQQAPYPPNGWRPSGAQFNLPTRELKQQEPAASYGPPEIEETTTEAEPTTTEAAETTTFEPELENLEEHKQRPGSYYVVVPQQQQPQKYVVAQKSAPLIATKVPIQAYPAFAKIQEVPQVFEAVPIIQVASSAYTSSVYTPYSSSFVQVVQ